MKTQKTYPTLYSLNTNDSIQQWTIGVYGNIILKEYGQVGGKIQTTTDKIEKGKNTGKANATTPETQALAEAQSQWEKKLKSGYCRKEEEARQGGVDNKFVTGGVEPMLAKSFKDHENKIIYPCFAQPKLDGHRCVCVVSNGIVSLWSRTRKPITSVPHIIEAMEATFPNNSHIRGYDETITLDGELYNHAYKNSFEEITSFIRSQTPKTGYEIVEYHIYDLIDDSLTFKERTEKIQKIKFASNKIVKVETRIIHNTEELMEYFAVCREAGYEGSMVRNAKSPYRHGRSYDLQKIKSFSDDEFEVIGVKRGRGRMSDCAIFVCRIKNGQEFSCKMEGPLENLEKYLSHPEIVIGKQLTIKFQNLTADGLPRFPVGIRIRSPE